MSWQNRYILPWAGLRHDQIAAAADHVMQSGRGLELTRYELHADGPNKVDVFFYFRAALERRWTMYRPDVERNFRDYNIADDDEAFVHIEFDHAEADEKLGLPAETSLELYSNI